MFEKKPILKWLKKDDMLNVSGRVLYSCQQALEERSIPEVYSEETDVASVEVSK